MFWDASSEDQWKATSATAGEFGLRLVGVELRERPYDYEAALTQAHATTALLGRRRPYKLDFMRFFGTERRS
jgi:hypothetical protein